MMTELPLKPVLMNSSISAPLIGQKTKPPQTKYEGWQSVSWYIGHIKQLSRPTNSAETVSVFVPRQTSSTVDPAVRDVIW